MSTELPETVLDVATWWPKAVGPIVAAHLEAVAVEVETGVLVLKASSRAWATQFQLLQKPMRRRINAYLDGDYITGFKVHQPPLTEAQKAALELTRWWSDVAGEDLADISLPARVAGVTLIVYCFDNDTKGRLLTAKKRILDEIKQHWRRSPLFPRGGKARPILDMAVEVDDGTARILVTGSRRWAHPETVEAALLEAWHDATQDGYVGITVVHGACPTGADAQADAWAKANGVRTLTYSADWLAHGKAAGPIRNEQMVAESRATLCLAFFTENSHGTADCVARAQDVGIPIRRWTNDR